MGRWSRGFFRIWIVITAILLIGSSINMVVALTTTQKYAYDTDSGGSYRPLTQEETKSEVKEAAARFFGVGILFPLSLLGTGWTFRWIVRGFQKRDG